MKAGGRVIGSIRFPFTIVMRLLMAGTGAAETNVAICLEKENVMDLVEVFSRDHAIASMMFSGIGVKTDWHGYYRCRVRRDKPIVIQMTTDTPESNRPGAVPRSPSPKKTCK